MNVFVTIDLTVPPQKKHVAQMQSAARSLTNHLGSVQVTCPTESPKKICVRFTVPDARQSDVVDRIGRQFWQVDNYDNSSIGFSPAAKSKRRISRSNADAHLKRQVMGREVVVGIAKGKLDIRTGNRLTGE